MACKIPVVVTKTPGFLEVVNSYENGLFVNIDDVKDAANNIIRLISDEELRLIHANQAFKRVNTFYNLNDNINKQIELYNLV